MFLTKVTAYRVKNANAEDATFTSLAAAKAYAKRYKGDIEKTFIHKKES